MARWRRAFFEGVYRLVRYRAWWVLFTSLLLSSLALYAVRDLPTRASFLDLLPRNDPLLEQFRVRESLLQQSDSLQILLRLIDAPASPEAGVGRLTAAAEQVVRELRVYEGVREASYQIDPRLALFQQLGSDNERLRRIEQALKRVQSGMGSLSPELVEQGDLAQTYAALNAQLEGQTQATEQINPQALREALDQLKALNAEVANALQQLQSRPGSDEPSPIERTLAAITELHGLLGELEAELQRAAPNLSRNRRSLLIEVRPAQPSYADIAFNERLIERVERALERAELPARGISAGVSGAYAFTAQSNRAMQRDVLHTTLISLGGILLVFLLTFRRMIYPALVIIPLSMSAVWTAAWARVAFDGFNLITAMLPALLLGLGINYGIHFVSRFLEERGAGRGVSGALHEAILHKGEAMLSGALTTALVFFVMMSSHSRGLYEMGLVAGVGVLVSVALTLLVLPALLVLAHLVLRRHMRRAAGFRWTLRPLMGGVLRGRRSVILLVLLITAGLLGPASSVRVRFISEELEVTGLPSQTTRAEIRAAGFATAGTSGDYFVFFLPAQDQVRALTDALARSDLVLNVVSAQNYFQSQVSLLQDLDLDAPFDQSNALIAGLLDNLANRERLVAELQRMENNLRQWKDLADLVAQRPIVEETNALIVQLLNIQTELNRLNVDQLQFNLVQLGSTLDSLRAIAGRTLNVPGTIDGFLNALPQDLRNRLITEENEFIVYVELSKDVYLEGNYERFIATVDAITSNYIGPPMIQHQLEVATESDFWNATLWALGLITLSLLFDFAGYGMRSAPLLVLLPLAVGYAWMLGGMGLLGISFNLTNMVISPLLIGIGVDNGIHLLHRYLERRSGAPRSPELVRRATQSVAMPVLVANLTTMTAFGSMLFASTPGLQVFGKSALLGVSAVALCSLTLLPAVLAGRR